MSYKFQLEDIVEIASMLSYLLTKKTRIVLLVSLTLFWTFFYFQSERSFAFETVALDFFITWSLGLTPALLIRYLLFKRPISKRGANWVAGGFSFAYFLLFRWVQLVNDMESSSGFVWILVFWVARWILLQGKHNPQKDTSHKQVSEGTTKVIAVEKPNIPVVSIGEKIALKSQNLLSHLTHKRIVLTSIALPVLFFVTIVLIGWTIDYNKEVKLYSGYIDEMEYFDCRLKIRVYPEDFCSETWKIYDKTDKKRINLKKYLTRHESQLQSALQFAIPVAALVIYGMFLAPFLYIRCSHIGWKRLAMVSSLAPTFIVMAGVMEDGDGFAGVVFFPLLLTFSISVVLGCREIVLWVQTGFKKE